MSSQTWPSPHVRQALSYRYCARPSFWSGVARLLDLGGTFNRYNNQDTPAEIDRRALASDWAHVGQDLAGAMNHFSADVVRSRMRG